MTIQIRDGLTFSDVLLEPKYSTIKSRSEIDLNVKLSKGLSFKFPLIPANMKTITGPEMAIEIASLGGLAILHRFMSIEEQLSIAKSYIKEAFNHIGFSIGIKSFDHESVDMFASLGVKILCIDIAHGDSLQCIEMAKYIAEKYPDIFLIAGNVATAEGARRLWLAGADCVKVNIGAGSTCSTRIETGNGVPQLTALSDVYDERILLQEPTMKLINGEWQQCGASTISKPIFIIADGGCVNAGDCVKSLCFGDMVMTGNLFAATDETPGDILQVDGQNYKSYVGSSTHKTNHIEGVAAIVPTKGPVKNVIEKLCQGIKSGLSYQGASNLDDLKKNPKFIRITHAGLIESHPHDVKVVK